MKVLKKQCGVSDIEIAILFLIIFGLMAFIVWNLTSNNLGDASGAMCKLKE